MACKTLLVGFKPKDTFDELFPYETAMIEVGDYEDFKSKIDYFSNDRERYSKIVDQNYEYLMGHHTWHHRAKRLLKILEDV